MPLYGGAEPAADSPMDGMPMGEEMGSYEPKDDEERAYMEAFPDNAWDEDRMAAMKEGVRLCVEKNMAGEYGGDSEEKPPSGKGGGLALIFGEPKKKR